MNQKDYQSFIKKAIRYINDRYICDIHRQTIINDGLDIEKYATQIVSVNIKDVDILTFAFLLDFFEKFFEKDEIDVDVSSDDTITVTPHEVFDKDSVILNYSLIFSKKNQTIDILFLKISKI